MPKTAAKTKSAKPATTKSVKSESTAPLNSLLQNEVARLSEQHGLSHTVLEEFAYFVIANHKKKEPAVKSKKPKLVLVDGDGQEVVKPVKVKPLTLPQLKTAIYQHFSVKNTTELKKSGAFKMATDGIDALDLSVKEGWEKLYRKFVGILPGEENQQGYGCINGINVFQYFKPWQIFELDPQTATQQDIKNAYHRLSKIYHPDVARTGDAAIFDCLTVMYKSISAEA